VGDGASGGAEMEVRLRTSKESRRNPGTAVVGVSSREAEGSTSAELPSICF
jgi:hypothetical protein